MSVANVLAMKFLRLNDNQLQLNLKSILEFDMIMKLALKRCIMLQNKYLIVIEYEIEHAYIS